MAVVRVPLYGHTMSRDSSADKDQRFINCFPEVMPTGKLDQDKTKDVDDEDLRKVFVTKRPGLEEADTTATAAGRGIYSWNGSLYAVVGDTVYKDGSAITGTTLDDTTGRVNFDVTQSSTKLIIGDPDNTLIYTVATDDTITKVTDSGGDLPTSMLPGIVHLDGYTCVMDNDSSIYNSVLNKLDDNDDSAWIGDFLTPEVVGDPGVGLIRHVNYLAAFGERSIEFFVDEGNATGSPFSRFEGTAQLVGAAKGTGNCLVNVDKKLVFVGQSWNGGRFVGVIEGFTPQKVSTKSIDEILDAEGSNISNAYAYSIRIMGHQFYVLTLPTTAAKTLVFDLEDYVWHEWTSYNGSTETYFTGVDACEHNGIIKVLDEDNGKIYNLKPSVYQDDSNTIKVAGFTGKIDGETTQNKYCSRLTVIGDQDGTDGTDLSISWTDDDYQNFNTARTVDLNDERPQLTRCGRFRRRAFKYTFENNRPMRLEAFELSVRLGHYGR